MVPQPISHLTQFFWQPDTAHGIQQLGQGFGPNSSVLTCPTPGSTGGLLMSDMYGISDQYLIAEDADALPSLGYLPKWAWDANPTTNPTNPTFGEYSDTTKLEHQTSSFEPVEPWRQFRDTVDPSELGLFDNYASLDDGESIINPLSGNVQSGLPNDIDPFGLLTQADAPTLDNQQVLEPFIPDSVFDQEGFDGSAHTTEHDAEDYFSPNKPYAQSTSGLPSVCRGDPGRRNTSRDEELIKLRMLGVSYRDIKKKYGFDVAESTLRGRIRSLTKAKEQRLRKPVWKPKDISLLCSCVIEFAIQHNLAVEVVGSHDQPVLVSEETVNKISWKRVAETMAKRGTYHYGNATTKKKYKEVRDEQLRRFAH
ncbi:hypothetical protein DV735_g5065, partial [Chaetothyriales sp. CBS 134920]